MALLDVARPAAVSTENPSAGRRGARQAEAGPCVRRCWVLQYATMETDAGKGRRKTPVIVAHLTTSRQGVWPPLGVPSPSLTRRVSHNGVGAFVKARVACLVPAIDVVTVAVDSGFFDKKSSNHRAPGLERWRLTRLTKAVALATV